MSDLVNSCEYFTSEKNCSAVAENRKVRDNRQVKCGNPEKASCCYLCTVRPQCSISCKYLGSPDAVYVPVGPASKALTENAVEEPIELGQTERISNPANHCPRCDVSMSEAKTELRVEGWKGSKPNMPSADMLPVIVYLCPKCGKIEFEADRRQSKD